MAFVGRLHPLVIHSPIALVIFAVSTESAATLTGDGRWHTVAVANLRAGAAFAVMAVVVGWRLALAPGIETTSLLEWHRWLGIMGTGVMLAAALATFGADGRSPFGCGSTGSRCSARERLWPSRGISEDYGFRARTSCVHEGGTCGTNR